MSYLGAVAAFIFFLLIAAVSDSVPVEQVPVQSAVPSAATSPDSAVPNFTLPPLSLLSFEPSPATTSTETQAIVAPKKVAVPAHAEATTSSAVGIVAAAPILAPQPAQPSISENGPLDVAASTLRSTLVNIICYVPSGSVLHSISGSGIFVDPKGIILTNAHIAQYFLLSDLGVSCTIRSGSPAVNRYNAKLIYIPTAWINANAGILTKTAPRGTGEYDFAFIAVTSSANTNALPSDFPSIPLATTAISSGTPIVIASYGAQFLESSQVRSSLFPTIVFGSVKDVYTFATNTVDVLALGGSAAAQEGSSGGGVAGSSGNLVGTITTSTVEGATDTRSLSAITSSYIRAAYAGETGRALDLLLAEPVASSVASFAPQIPALESILTANLP